METAQHHNCHLLLPANRRRQQDHPKNVRTTAGESSARLGGVMALKNRSFPIISIVAGGRFQNLNRSFCATSTRSADSSVEEARDKGEGAARDKEAAEEEEEVTLPPPPERPLPGDCCGSGCVRCVWDVYHEELQVYRNLIDKVKSAH